MFKNYFKIAIRQLRKQRMYSVVKIGGFAFSIAACLLIALYIWDEMNYDRSYPDADRIYRVTLEFNNGGKMLTGASWPAPLAKALTADFPEVAQAGRLMGSSLFEGAGSNQIRREDRSQNTYEEGFAFADQAMLDILKIPMVYGDRAHALAEPNTIVLSKRKADKYFPGENPVGKVIILNDDRKRPFKVGGVMEDLPTTSHIQYDFLLTLTGYQLWPGEQTTWMASNYSTYVLLKPGASAANLQSKLGLVLTKYYVPALKQAGNTLADQIEKNAHLLLQPIRDVHLRSYNIDDGLLKGDIRFVWLFGAIAGFILLIACINFINLSTAKSANRAKEVGLRKVVGSYRISLIRQFLVESLLFSFLSFILGIILTELLLPYFNSLTAKSLSIPWTAWWLLPLMILAAFVVGVLAGIYPAFYLSAFKPIQVLKGKISKGSKNARLQNGLVVFQFTASIILIIGTFVIYQQMQFILTRKTGFDKDQVMLIQGTNTLGSKAKDFKNALITLSSVKTVSIADYLPISGTKRDGNPFWKEGRSKIDEEVSTQKWRVDADYIRTMGMKIVEGRDFLREGVADSSAIIINKAMVQKLGLKNPIGQALTNSWEKFTVIGVIDDFNFETMRQEVTPLALALGNDQASIMAVKTNGGDAQNTIASVTAVWKKFAPNQPIRFTFLDESFANMYADVQRIGRIFSSFALLAIIIACLGLFALSAFMAEQRNREIGIRKVLGASVEGITVLLSGNFIKLVLLAILIASPIAWWAMNKWLQDFAYHITISWWIFPCVGGVAILIALITIGFQSIKAAIANPVDSLRAE